MEPMDLWRRYQRYLCVVEPLDISLDISRMRFDEGFFERMDRPMRQAFRAMDALEAGEIANPDEGRMVGHYWLRAPELAPDQATTTAIQDTQAAVRTFADDVHAGRIAPRGRPRFTQVLSLGVGGSALGPMLVSEALGDAATDKMAVHFIDNTDPDGISAVLDRLDVKLPETLCLVISKSGGTPETRNAMIHAAAAYAAAGLDFAAHAVAITGTDSKLDRQARDEDWLARFPMWDWVGGRTSEWSAVGLLPAALQGLDIGGLLAGAADCDVITRRHDPLPNPAALLALMWYHATAGRGARDMVVLPYKDRLSLFARYLQQLVMESLGKRLDLQGERVDQGLTVYGNKGSTDQHAYVQQLRDGIDNFFAIFIRVLESGGQVVEVEPGITAGDYLHGFLLGTRAALFDNDRESMTITVPRVDARIVGGLMALFERAVGFYASLIGVNAYHQPGVEAGKKAAAAILDLQTRVICALSPEPRTAERLAEAIETAESAETVYALLEHLAANGQAERTGGAGPAAGTFRAPT